MEWQQILGFYQVARTGSFTQAARATFRTQSALSQQVKALETEFECQLIERIGKRKLRLTDEGRLFFQFASEVIEKFSDFKEKRDEIKGESKGSLTIAAPFTTLYHLFPSILTAYIKQFPEVKLTVLDRSQREVIDLVKNGEIDFGFALESMIPGHFEIHRCLQLETVLITPRRHPLTGKRRVTWRRIAQYPLILPPQDLRYPARILLEEHLRRSGSDGHIIMESSNVEINARFVEMGAGISFATVASDIDVLKGMEIEFIPLGHYFKPDFLSAFTRKEKMLPFYKKTLLDLFVQNGSIPGIR